MTTALRHGDRSQAVRDLQKKLNVHGANLVADGDYGDATEAAVRAYQVKVGLVRPLCQPRQQRLHKFGNSQRMAWLRSCAWACRL